jgi:hypothetical protein
MEVNKCVQQAYVPVKSNIQRIKKLVKLKGIDNKRITTRQIKNRAPVKKTIEYFSVRNAEMNTTETIVCSAWQEQLDRNFC